MEIIVGWFLYFTPGMKSMRPAAVFFALLAAGTAFAQSSTTPRSDKAQVHFTVADPQREPAQYSLEFFEDGTGRYTAASGSDPGSQDAARTIQIHDPVLTRVFGTARSHHYFAMECADARAKVTFTGNKTLAYSGPDGTGSCTFNYSKDQSLNQAAAELMAVAYTIVVGDQLAGEHLHDRLGLDEELQALQEAAGDHRALELGNIAPVLESIANDDAVMTRARGRARALLSGASSNQ